MSYQVNILHISDLHARGPEEKELWRRDAVLGKSWNDNLAELRRHADIDLVCFTGDLANKGMSQEYNDAKLFLTNTITQLGLGPERLFIIPGNHDINRYATADAPKKLRTLRKKIDENDSLAISRWLMGEGHPEGLSDKIRDIILGRRKEFDKFLQDFGLAELLPENSSHGRLGYRVTRKLPKLPFPINIIGLDSAWSCGDNNDCGKIWLTDDQVVRLCADSSGQALPGLSIAMLHHPLSHLIDQGSSRKYLSKYIHFLLRGHLHESEPEIWSDPERSILQIATGSIYEGSKANTWKNSCVLICASCDSTGKPVGLTIRFRAYSPRAEIWHDDNSLYRNAKDGRLAVSFDAAYAFDSSSTLKPPAKSNSSTSDLALFSSYSVAAEPYYLKRQVDIDLPLLSRDKNIWYYGASGTGKTCILQRHILTSKTPTLHISLGACRPENPDDCLMNVCHHLCEHTGHAGKISRPVSKSILTAKRSLESFLKSNNLWIHIDEIPISNSDRLQDFANRVLGLLDVNPNLSSKLRVFISSIGCPMINAAQRRILERTRIIECFTWSNEDISRLCDILSSAMEIKLNNSEISKLLEASGGLPRFVKEFFRNMGTFGASGFEQILSRTKTEQMEIQR